MNGRTVTTLGLALLCAIGVLSLPIDKLIFFLSDDAYYYLNVARNIVHGAGSSFDGINPSNGYHPLWMVCLLPVYALFGNAPELALRIVLLLQVALVGGTFRLACDVYKRYSENALSTAVGLGLFVVLYSPFLLMFNGLETSLVVFLVVLLIRTDAGVGFLGAPPTAARQALFGLLLGLLVLARLDGAFIILAVAAWSLLGMQPGGLIARIVYLCRSYWLTVVVFIGLLAPYFVWNVVEFGHLTPISGALKSTFPHPILRWRLLVKYAPYTIATLLVGVALLRMSLALRKPERARPRLTRANLDLLIGLWIGCVLQIGWAVFFTSWGTYQWHFAAHIPLACLVLGVWISQWPHTPPSAVLVRTVTAVTVIIAAAYSVLVYCDKGDHHERRYAAALWARSNTPDNAVFALRDAGVFGYFSDRPTVNLDGLINSYEYQVYVRSGRLLDFLRERGVTFIADAYSPCRYVKHRIWIRAFRAPTIEADTQYALMTPRASEVYRSEEFMNRPLSHRDPVCFIAWPLAAATLDTFGPGEKKSDAQ